MRLRRILFHLTLWLAVAGVGAGFLVYRLPSLWLPYLVVLATNRGVEIDPAEDPPVESLAAIGVTDALRVEVGPPAASLSVWVMRPEGAAPPRGTILVLHGIRDQKRTMRGVARAFRDAGYTAVLVDLRGHGRSTGDDLSYGVFDGRDLSQVLDELDRRGLLTLPVGVYGPSYGGAAGLQLAARDERVGAVVTIATFSRLRDVVPAYCQRFLPLDALIDEDSVDAAVSRAGLAAGFDADEADCVAAIAKTRARVLIVHGDADDRVPVAHARELAAAAGGRGELLIVPGKDHIAIFRGDTGGGIVKRSLAFFDETLPSHALPPSP